MIKKLILILFTFSIITSNTLGAGSDGGTKVKKLSSYDSAVKRITKAKK